VVIRKFFSNLFCSQAIRLPQAPITRFASGPA
jgi:hypothetical protein